MFYLNYVRLCNQRGISPSAAAAEMGLTKAAITRWGQGSSPRAATLQLIADYFGISVEELLAEPEEEQKKDTANGGVLDDILRQMHHMSSVELLDIISYASSIIKDRG